MKKLLLLITIILLQACTHSEPKFVRRCGKVIDKFLEHNELNSTYKIVYETETHNRYVISRYGDESLYVQYDIGDNICETVAIYE